jgi:hypothetical protein
MTENLLTPSVIKLFGRVMNDLSFNYDPSTVVTGFNNLLQRQLYNGYDGSTPTTVIIEACTVVFNYNTGISTSTVVLDPNGSLVRITPGYSRTGLASGMQITDAKGTPPNGPPNTLILDPTLPPNAPPIVTNTSISYDPYPPNIVAPGPPPVSNTDGTGFFSVSIPFIVPTGYLPPPPPPPPPAMQSFTIDDVTITATTPDQSPKLARIYGFSFEGSYYGLPRPSIFLIHGPGTPAGSWFANSALEQAGVAAREWDFSGNQLQDITYWEYDKGDFSIRLDPEAGPFEQILLQMALRAGADMADRATPRSGSGLDTRSGSGLDTRSGSGLDTRSGSGLRR